MSFGPVVAVKVGRCWIGTSDVGGDIGSGICVILSWATRSEMVLGFVEVCWIGL